MNPKEEIRRLLDAHGSRNQGDDLRGFAMDVDGHLHNLEAFAEVWSEPIGDPDCMVQVEGVIPDYLPVDDALENVLYVWQHFLRYQQFEKTFVEKLENGFDVYFVTYSEGLGVNGKISGRYASQASPRFGRPPRFPRRG